jgi:hypothetical protein
VGGPAGALPEGREAALPVALLALAAAAALLFLVPTPGPARAAVELLFVTLGPGIALVRLVRLESLLAELMLGIALSLVLAGLVSGTFLYLGAWSPGAILGVLVTVAAGGAAIDLLVLVRARRTGPEPAAMLPSAIEARLAGTPPAAPRAQRDRAGSRDGVR